MVDMKSLRGIEIMRLTKYHSSKVVNEYGTFDSKKEARRYKELLNMADAEYIRDLKRQVSFILIPKQKLKTPRDNGKRLQHFELPVRYVADFTYYQDGEYIVEDTKGIRTPEYIIKRKLMLERYGIQIKEV